MVKILKKTTFKKFYAVNEYVAKTTPMHTHYHSQNPLEKWLWQKKKSLIKKSLSELNIKNIIDLGCGDGGLLELVKKNIKYTGIDISPTQVKFSLDQIKKIEYKNAKVYIGDITNLKFANNTFDAALVCDVVEHIISPEKLFSELKRVIKKDGYIIFSIPNEIFLQSVRALLLKFPLRSPDHINSVSPLDIKQNFPKILKEFYVPLNFSFKLSLIGILVAQNEK
ncbi:MAG: class I SAM-dependent methyltransferase [Candidatus Daviesbacteria bacterium]|nr:class I SAM-dependent methyltransferase [Candidatus Daviesbacteria bacterium]